MSEQRVVVVTGGGSGIGRAVATRFTGQGDQVIILGRTDAKLRHVVDELGDRASYKVVDVSQREQVELAIASITQKFEHVDVLVNNAGFVKGISTDTPLAQAEAVWEQEVGSNLKGAFLMAVGLAPHLVRPGGRIINIGSIAAYTGGIRGGTLGYASAKAGMHGLTCALARELSPQGITVNTISPGLVSGTDFFGGGLAPDRIQEIVTQVPLGRPGKPDDIASVVFFLASNEASYITGEVIHVNGGWLFGH
ncbi:MAG: SDR family oxidoreductase [Chloroflexi bacterium]|nr:SDR family oxidoreductase [Chloroflexota bacterium]